jgi:hypothetical protein
MEVYGPFTFLRSWALVVLYMCFRFHYFNRFILEEYVFQVERGPHLFQSCFHAIQNNILPIFRKMHSSFESLTITSAPILQASLMDIRHDTSFRSILEHDLICSTFKAHICFCLGKGVGLWLIVKPFICLFRIAHFTFILTLHFHLGSIQPLTFNLFTCECGHGLNASSTHLAHCLFEGQ